MISLYEKLEAYRQSEYYGFHMPGHKRNEKIFGQGLPYGIDITEIEGFDDLHHAEGIIEQAEERAACLYKAEETHFLINGSTVGILSAILGTTRRGGRILVARNCHKSVYNAIDLNGLIPVYLYPEYEKEFQINGGISPDQVKEVIENYPDIQAVMIVSPTYDGVVSDVEQIANIVHEKGIPLIVDEAHGAHFGFHPYFPDNSNTKGADIVIHSVHKTLPALTQTALIHMNGNRIDRNKVWKYLHMLQSSSPSYILMASIDKCMALLEEKGREIFNIYVERIEKLRKELKRLKHLEILETKNFDRSKFIVSVRHANLTSGELYEKLLENYLLQMEMKAGTYVLAMTTIGDTEEGLKRFAQALFEIDAACQWEEQKMVTELPRLPFVYTIGEVEEKKKNREEILLWDDAEGKVATEYAYVYPPGIPLVVPGERITKEAIDVLNLYKQLGFSVEGIHVEKHIGVLKNG